MFGQQQKPLTCSEKVSELEELLQRIMDGPKNIAEVKAGPINKQYRVSSQGTDLVIPFHPDLKELAAIKPGETVLVAKGMIVGILPKELISHSKKVEFTPLDWSEIGGMKSQISNIKELIEIPMQHKDICKDFNMPMNNGVILYGPPGCEKTIIAKAIASTITKGAKITADSFIYEKGGEMLSPYVGMAEARIKNLFERCRLNFKETGVQSILFIDEAEAIMPTRGSRKSSDVEKTIVPTFLAEMDGFADNNPFVILATNNPDDIDPAIKREGRIDLMVGVNRPTKDDAIEIFSIHLKKTKVAGNINTLAQQAADSLFKLENIDNKVSGAMIQRVVQAGIQNAIKRRIADKKSEPVNLLDLETSISNL